MSFYFHLHYSPDTQPSWGGINPKGIRIFRIRYLMPAIFLDFFPFLFMPFNFMIHPKFFLKHPHKFLKKTVFQPFEKQ